MTDNTFEEMDFNPEAAKFNSYSVSKGEGYFDWYAFLKKGRHTPAETTRALKYVQSWVTCACGNRCVVIPRDEHGEPLDHDLRELGVVFMLCIDMLNDAVHNKFIQETIKHSALYVLTKIEERSAFLIRQINKESKQ